MTEPPDDRTQDVPMRASGESGLLPLPVPGGQVYKHQGDIPKGRWNALVKEADELYRMIEEGDDFRKVSGMIAGFGRDEQRSFDTNVSALERPVKDAMVRVQDKGGEGPQNVIKLQKMLQENAPSMAARGTWWQRLLYLFAGGLSDKVKFNNIVRRNMSIRSTIETILNFLREHMDLLDKDLLQIQQLFNDVGQAQVDLLCRAFVLWIVTRRTEQLLTDKTMGTARSGMLKNVHAGAMRRLTDMETAAALNEQNMQNLLTIGEATSLTIHNLDRTITLVAPAFKIQFAAKVFSADLHRAQISERVTTEFLGDMMVQTALDAEEEMKRSLERATSPGIAIEKFQKAHDAALRTIELQQKAVDLVISRCSEDYSILSDHTSQVRKSNQERLQADPFDEFVRDQEESKDEEK